MEGVADIGNQCALLGYEVELGVDVTVYTFTSLTADGDDGGVGGLHLLADGDGGETDLRIFLLTHILGLEPFCRMALGLELHSGIVDVLAIDVGQCG